MSTHESHNPTDPTDPTDYTPSQDVQYADGALTYDRSWPNTELIWSRVGKHYNVPDLDVTGIVDLVGLESFLRAEIQDYLVGHDWAIRMTVQVHIDGGGYRRLPFGRGEIQNKPVKADE